MAEYLDLCENFSDVFDIVKRSTENSLKQSRAGLMLYLARLPDHVTTFHPLGSNGIVMNRTVLDALTRGGHSLRNQLLHLLAPTARILTRVRIR